MAAEYLQSKKIEKFPRLPLEGKIDLTYRCNNNCRHCWLRIPANAQEKQKELSLEELFNIVDEARKMGCRQWFISGGEPMLRPDFAEIFDYITRKSVHYSLNTNGTLITPKIAQLMKREGTKMVAIYGATAEVHDHITRNPGSFDATMRGFAYLKEAGANFISQVIPMKDNYHQLDDMILLAETMSSHSRIGAPWLYLSASGDPTKNREILSQRLDPKEAVKLDKPDINSDEWMKEESEKTHGHDNFCAGSDDRLFAACISSRRDFYINPYGQMTFCDFIKDPKLYYNLKAGSFKEGWDEFIPSLADKVRGGREYMENCGSCELRSDCRWCPVYGYLEHRRFSAKVDYLCDVAKENRMYKEEWKKDHQRFYKIAGITIRLRSAIPITDNTFLPKFKPFRVDGPGEDNMTVHHYFSLPNLDENDLGEEVYRRVPWAIYRKDNSWIYVGIHPLWGAEDIHRIGVFNDDHTKAKIYHPNAEWFLKGGRPSLTLITDQIALARVLADREGCFMHSAGAILASKGFLFAGHSGAGKSTVVKLLMDKAEILCDDRIIVRQWPDGIKIHGTWSHGEVPVVSSNSAPLKAIMFLRQSQGNRLIPIEDRHEIIQRLLAYLIKPLVTVDWLDKMLAFISKLVREVPCYILEFDKSGQMIDLIKQL